MICVRVLAITTIRNEAPFILEWLAYHQHIGVTDFLIYSNDCEDGSDDLLDRLAARGILHHERNHSKGKKSVQWRALRKANRHAAKRAAEWVYVIDVDEFLCIHAGAGRLIDLIGTQPDAEGFLIPWRMFGNNDVTHFADVPILAQFTKAAPERLLWPWRAVQFKSLYRNDDKFARLGVHRPQLREGAEYGLWCDGNAEPCRGITGTVIPTTRARYALAQINHYALGARDSFLVKVARGKPNHSSDPIDLAYWIERNLNEVSDTRILQHQDQVTQNMEVLMADAQTAALHHAGVAWRKQRIKDLLRAPEPFYLMSRLMQLGASQVLPMKAQSQQMKDLLALLAAQRRG